MLAHRAGRPDDAEPIYVEAVARMARAGSVHAEAFLLIALCTLRLTQGRMAELAEPIRASAERYPDAADALALALVAAGRPDEARAARARPVPLRPDYFFTVFATIRALAVVALGARDEAAALVDSLRPWRDQLPGAISSTVVMQPVALTLGHLCRLLDRDAEADEHFRHAERVARHWGAPHWADAARRAASR
jgi:hypothetical protein